MAKAKRSNVKTAPKLRVGPLPFLTRVLSLIGKPLYLLLIFLIISFLFLSQLIGKVFLSTFKVLADLAASLFFFPTLLKRRLVLLPKKPELLRLRTKLPKYEFKLRFPKLSLDFSAKVALLVIASFLFLFWFLVLKDLPSPQELVGRDLEVSTKIYDRNGLLLYKIYKDKNRTLVPLSEIPVTVRLATLAAEDAEFYRHSGFSVKGIVRAIIRNAKGDGLSGGSTITQQLVKNALLTPKKSFIRKVREIILSVQVELVFTKDEILEMYLNEVSYGGTAYGIQEASRIYFDKDVDGLSLAEAALLAGLPKSPTKFSPFGPTPEAGLARQKDVLNLLVVNKFASQEEVNGALKEKLTFAENRTDIKAPHFVMFVRQLLEEKYGEEVVEQGGLEVTTTLDYALQAFAEEAVKEELAKLSSLNVGNAALVVISPRNGEILAMVGSRDYFDTRSDGNVNVTTAPRQPGSSIKVVNYAYALSNGYTPATILSDTPVSFSIPGQEPYSPKNYDSSFRGNLTLRSAFAESRNVPAVKVLASYGVEKMVEMGKKLGITTWEDSRRFGLSLTLGGGEVKLIDLASVYATVASGGVKGEIVSVQEVSNYKGDVLEKNKCGAFLALAAEAAKTTCQKEKVLDERVAFLLTDILSDNEARTPAFGRFSMLNIPGHPEVAVKTGTSNNLRDNWTIGYNQDYLVAVWVGNNDNSPMARVASGVTGASPIWHKVMTALLSDKESLSWEVPEGVTQIAICPLTATLPCQGCPTKNEWFLEETLPKTVCRLEMFTEKEEKENKNVQGRLLPEAATIERVDETTLFSF